MPFIKIIMKYYDAISEAYDELYKEEQLDKLNKIKDLVKFKGLVLDLGCGTGFITEKIPNVIGCDSSEKMLAKCSKKLKVVHCDAVKLPFEDNYFDTVFSLTVLQDIKEYKQAIKEIRRVLKNNGNIIITVLDKERIKLIRDELKKVFKNIKEKKIGKDVLFFT